MNTISFIVVSFNIYLVFIDYLIVHFLFTNGKNQHYLNFFGGILFEYLAIFFWIALAELTFIFVTYHLFTYHQKSF